MSLSSSQSDPRPHHWGWALATVSRQSKELSFRRSPTASLRASAPSELTFQWLKAPRESMTGMTRHKVPPGEPDRNTWQEWSMYHTPQKRHDDKSSIPL